MHCPQLIAIGFYDGPTEGFAQGVEGIPVCFFKVVAWDENQDRRLYLLSRVDERTYEELVAILAKSQGILPNIWTPDWSFDEAAIELRANRIVDEARRSLAASALVALGESPLGVLDVIVPTSRQLESARNLADAEWPGNLDDWLALG